MSLEFKTQLQSIFGKYAEVRLAVLFGSFARGNSHAQSDIDIALLISDCNRTRVQQLEAEIGRTLKRTIDIIYINKASPLLRFEIASEGELLIESTPGLWSAVRVRAMTDWWDWAPYARRINAGIINHMKEKSSRG